MSDIWNRLKQKKRPVPPLVLEYGPEKAGKSTLASEYPDPVFIQAEDGTAALDVAGTGKLNTFEEAIGTVGMLFQKSHDFRTVVVDSVTALQPLIYAETCRRGDEKGNTKARIEDFPYGKGYIYALAVWQEFLDGLNALRRDRGMNVVLIAHSKIERFEDPETSSYSRYDIDLHEKARDLLKRESDVILLLKPDVVIKTEEAGFNRQRARADGGRSVWMHLTSRPAYAAGNRYGMPERILYERGKGYAALAPYFPTTPETASNAA